MTHPRLLLSMALAYLAIVACILSARPVEASSHRGDLAMLHVAIDQATPQPPVADLPEGKGKELTKKQCGTCHANNVWTNQHHTREQWSAVIDNMVSKGMHASDDDLDTMTDYLAANFGPAATTPPATPPPSR